MKIYEKIIIFIEVLLTAFYIFIISSPYPAVDALVLIGSLIASILIPYFIAYIITFALARLGFSFVEIKGRKMILWKIFLIIYPITLTLSIIGNLTK